MSFTTNNLKRNERLYRRTLSKIVGKRKLLKSDKKNQYQYGFPSWLKFLDKVIYNMQTADYFKKLMQKQFYPIQNKIFDLSKAQNFKPTTISVDDCIEYDLKADIARMEQTILSAFKIPVELYNKEHNTNFEVKLKSEQ